VSRASEEMASDGLQLVEIAPKDDVRLFLESEGCSSGISLPFARSELATSALCPPCAHSGALLSPLVA